MQLGRWNPRSSHLKVKYSVSHQVLRSSPKVSQVSQHNGGFLLKKSPVAWGRCKGRGLFPQKTATKVMEELVRYLLYRINFILKKLLITCYVISCKLLQFFDYPFMCFIYFSLTFRYDWFSQILLLIRKAQLDFEHGTTQFLSEVKAFAHQWNKKDHMQNVNCVPESIRKLITKMVTNFSIEK